MSAIVCADDGHVENPRLEKVGLFGQVCLRRAKFRLILQVSLSFNSIWVEYWISMILELDFSRVFCIFKSLHQMARQWC